MQILDGKYTLRNFIPGDEEGILALWQTAFKSIMAPEIFRWKYLENPYSKAMTLCVSADGEIVTFYGGIPYRFQYRDRVFPVVHLMDIMSHPMHRENRIFEKTAKCFIEQFCTPENLLFMYGFPGQFHYSIGERILNYRKISSAKYFKLVFGPTCSENISTLTPVSTLTPGSDLPQGSALISGSDRPDADISPRMAGSRRGVDVQLLTDPDTDALWIDRLWERCSTFYPLSIARDHRFIKWRFFSHPHRKYTALKFTTGLAAQDKNKNCPEALVVMQINGVKASVVDMMMPDSSGLFSTVMSSTIEYLINMGVEEIETWLPDNHFLSEDAAAFGFESLPEPVGIIPTVALYDHSPSLEWVAAHLYYTMGDGDLL